MSELADNSIQCCVTSPPYWGLRKYAGEQDSIWGGKADCSHEWTSETRKQTGGLNNSLAYTSNQFVVATTNTCSLCGAWRGAYGLEPTVEMYVQHTVEILREIRRVLRKDGVVFWNVDDSYASTPGLSTAGSNMVGTTISQDASKGLPKRTFGTIKPKDLCLIPFRVAIAAQEDGWYVRSVIIWSKPNPMPESVADRPTGSHEYILMLTKSAKYYYDSNAVREKYESEVNHNPRDKASEKYDGTNLFSEGGRDYYANGGRNLRNVWTFPTQPYREAHFATFPEALPERCIKAATKEGDIVLDPFCGSGTTLEVAAKLNRHAVGYEISEEYCRLIVERNKQSVLL